MKNVKFEIEHGDITRALAKMLGIGAEQIELVPLTEEETSAVRAVVRTDLKTANKIERKLKRIKAEGEAEQG